MKNKQMSKVTTFFIDNIEDRYPEDREIEKPIEISGSIDMMVVLNGYVVATVKRLHKRVLGSEVVRFVIAKGFDGKDMDYFLITCCERYIGEYERCIETIVSRKLNLIKVEEK